MLTILLSAKALLAFGTGNEVRVAYGLVDEELLPFGLRDSLGWGARQGGAFALLYQAGNPNKYSLTYQFGSAKERSCHPLVDPIIVLL